MGAFLMPDHGFPPCIQVWRGRSTADVHCTAMALLVAHRVDFGSERLAKPDPRQISHHCGCGTAHCAG